MATPMQNQAQAGPPVNVLHDEGIQTPWAGSDLQPRLCGSAFRWARSWQRWS
jgi:hypothetical protein